MYILRLCWGVGGRGAWCVVGYQWKHSKNVAGSCDATMFCLVVNAAYSSQFDEELCVSIAGY